MVLNRKSQFDRAVHLNAQSRSEFHSFLIKMSTDECCPIWPPRSATGPEESDCKDRALIRSIWLK